MRQKVWCAIQSIAAAAIDCLPEVLGVPVNDDRGEQIQPSHSEVLSLGCSIANFTLAANA